MAVEPTTRPVIDPNGLYTKRRLAAVLEVDVRTIERQVSEGELPPPFPHGRLVYWTGRVLLKHFRTKQREALRRAGVAV